MSEQDSQVDIALVTQCVLLTAITVAGYLLDETESFDLEAAVPIIVAALESERARRSHRRTNPIRQSDIILPSQSSFHFFFSQANDGGFTSYFRLTRAAFSKLLSSFLHVWRTTRLYFKDQEDEAVSTKCRIRKRKCKADISLALTLRWLASGISGDDLSLLVGLVASTRSRILRHSLACLLYTLRNITEGRIALPSPQEASRLAEMVSQYEPHVLGCWGSLDGTGFTIYRHGGPEAIQRSFFNSRASKGGHYVRNLGVFECTGTLSFFEINHPGRDHDSRLLASSGLMHRLLRKYGDHHLWIAGDSAFPASRVLRRVLKEPEIAALPDGPEKSQALAVQRYLSKVRVSSEWGYAALENCWQILSNLDNRVDGDVLRAHVIEICARLNNFRIRECGINQLYNVYNNVNTSYF